ncbi:MAG: hypothetical protein ACOX3G_00955 [Armatimonadota bacterium]|jgi:hypothetical protein
MGRLIVIAATLLAFIKTAWAHGAEELGHHWEIGAYRNEIHVQLFLMAFIVVAAYAVTLIKRISQERKTRQ